MKKKDYMSSQASRKVLTTEEYLRYRASVCQDLKSFIKTIVYTTETVFQKVLFSIVITTTHANIY